MSIRRFFALGTLLLTGCGVPFVGGGDPKSECDRMAARAIETDSVEDARDLAAQATGCYARLAQ